MTASTSSNKNPAVLAADPDWWRGAVIYQIYPRSYLDSNGDGIGDLPGITTKLPYIAELGADAIWISPFMKSPMDDFGYDVSDYEDVDPMFGTLDDFKELVEKAHSQGLRVLIDLVISHTSDQHAWFKESRQDRTNPKADWYVWADAKDDGNPPNNWLSVFGGSSWQWDTRRNQYYLHNFLRSQPDLNFHNEEVQEAVLNAARFWLDIGVDGFRLDTANFYFHDKELRSNPGRKPEEESVSTPKTNPYGYQVHVYDKTRPENIAFLTKLRAVMDEYQDTTMVGEIGADEDPHQIIADYTAGHDRLHMAYSFDLLAGDQTAAHIREKVSNLEATINDGWASWAMSNHDVIRVVSRLGAGFEKREASSVLLAVVASLRGSPCLYQGEELGFEEANVAFEDLQDPYGIEFWPNFKGRDGCRTPMAWETTAPNGGFSTGKPWLPVDARHLANAVSVQENDPASALNRARTFLKWRRQHPALIKGDMKFLQLESDVLGFTRTLGEDSVLCVFNLSDQEKTISLTGQGVTEALEGHGFEFAMDGKVITLPAWQAGFLKLDA
ncbi:alpha-glucosidase family protein [Pseudovibrio exalbescens]|uniref:alpha-glucosidase family protein n=1 Tax=Pseudovibrio exalbescens TaxID=197461 RepID=UPI00236658C9|nr:alpha-glucosidase family protein [Pseudovibrio exalbescens]MDD7912095.1 alpha-glucosidase family protein [Pseudovibrio exalbescens]